MTYRGGGVEGHVIVRQAVDDPILKLPVVSSNSIPNAFLDHSDPMTRLSYIPTGSASSSI